jgi:hypothetical protein
MKLVDGLVGLLMLAGLVLGLKHYKHLADDRGAKLATICETTRQASGHPKLNCGEVPAQIGFMGEAIGTLTNALNRQNAAVQAMGDATKQQQAASAEALKRARTRADAATATASRLAASAAHGASGAACEPSAALKGAWQ